MPKTAVIIVSYNHGRFLRPCFSALSKVNYPGEDLKIFLIDNGSDETEELVKNGLFGGLPAVYIKPGENTGFTGGNNLAMRIAMREGFEYVYLLNPDTEADPDFLREAAAAAESDPSIGAVQSLLVLTQDPELLNSWGNEVHFLGFSFAGGYRERIDSREAEARLKLRDIGTASGAAVLLRLSALRLVGLFDEEIFAYHEDVDLSLRLSMAGFRVVLSPQSVVRHRYEFSRSIKKFYFMERNRYWVHLKNLKAGTLLLLLPAMIPMELGLWFYAISGGWWREKARAWKDLLKPEKIGLLLRERRRVQRLRTVPDRAIVKNFVPRILYQEIAHPLWEHFGNHVFAAYWFLAKRLILW